MLHAPCILYLCLYLFLIYDTFLCCRSASLYIFPALTFRTFPEIRLNFFVECHTPDSMVFPWIHCIPT